MMFLLIVTLTSMLLAAIMSVIAWRIAGDERRRSDARVAALANAIHAPAPAAPATIAAEAGGPARRATERWDADLELRPRERAAAGANLFSARPAATGGRPLAVVAGGTLVLGGALAMAMLFTGAFSRAPRAAQPAAAAPAAPLLELLALDAERDGDRLTVRGVVRNPASGAAVDGITAAVTLFASDGGVLASGHASVEPVLRPGGESSFAVTVPGGAGAGRYRVSFSTGGRVVPHLDGRHER